MPAANIGFAGPLCVCTPSAEADASHSVSVVLHHTLVMTHITVGRCGAVRLHHTAGVVLWCYITLGWCGSVV